MNRKEYSTSADFDREDAPNLLGDGWPENFAKATVRRGWGGQTVEYGTE